MPTWDELDTFAAPRRLLVLALALAAIVAIRLGLDATSPDFLGWSTWFVQFALAISLLGLCIARVVYLVRRRLKDRPAGEPLVAERHAIIALIAVVVIVRVIRGGGNGNLDSVALGVQLAAIAGLVAIGIRRVVLMVLGRSEFSAWPGFWLGLFVMTAGAVLSRDVAPEYEVLAIAGFVAALILLVVGVYRAVRQRREPR